MAIDLVQAIPYYKRVPVCLDIFNRLRPRYCLKDAHFGAVSELKAVHGSEATACTCWGQITKVAWKHAGVGCLVCLLGATLMVLRLCSRITPDHAQGSQRVVRN